MKKAILKTLITISFFYTSQNINGQMNTNNDTIIWSSCYKLKWEDFQGLPEITSYHGAITHAGVAINYRIEKNKLAFKSFAFFVKSLSWKKTNINDYALKHEQIHFDISEIFRRQLNDTLMKISLNKNLTKTQVDDVINFILDEMDEYQDLYDKETNFGCYKNGQKIWANKIQNELSKTK